MVSVQRRPFLFCWSKCSVWGLLVEREFDGEFIHYASCQAYRMSTYVCTGHLPPHLRRTTIEQALEARAEMRAELNAKRDGGAGVCGERSRHGGGSNQ